MKPGLLMLIGCLGLSSSMAAQIPTHYIRAIAEVESGDDDGAVGPNGERTRYQVLPKVWAEYSRTPIRSASPKHATDVAREILSDRWDRFVSRHGRRPSDEEVYALWHRPGRVHRLTKVEADRCERFGRVARRFQYWRSGR